MTTKKYLHTLGGRPAFYDGEQVILATKFFKLSDCCESPSDIDTQWEKSRAWRKEHDEGPGMYDHEYITIIIDEEGAL